MISCIKYTTFIDGDGLDNQSYFMLEYPKTFNNTVVLLKSVQYGLYVGICRNCSSMTSITYISSLHIKNYWPNFSKSNTHIELNMLKYSDGKVNTFYN
jgi:hypothetical protein